MYKLIYIYNLKYVKTKSKILKYEYFLTKIYYNQIDVFALFNFLVDQIFQSLHSILHDLGLMIDVICMSL